MRLPGRSPNSARTVGNASLTMSHTHPRHSNMHSPTHPRTHSLTPPRFQAPAAGQAGADMRRVAVSTGMLSYVIPVEGTRPPLFVRHLLRVRSGRAPPGYLHVALNHVPYMLADMERRGCTFAIEQARAGAALERQNHARSMLWKRATSRRVACDPL